MKTARLLSRFRIDTPARFRLAGRTYAETCGFDTDKDDAKAALKSDLERLSHLQERLYAHDRWAVLVILQGMDACGKDSAIKHVMSGINPQGCEVTSFKAPSAEELEHDFLWRHAVRLPTRGRIGIFNRSHYEEVLVVRVHPELLERQRLPEMNRRRIWPQRFSDICAFERYLVHNGTRVLKFFLNVSREEQRKRFLDRLDDPEKRWKFSVGDIAERKLWNKYMAAYEDMIRHTSIPEAPWYVVPADDKWFCRMIIGAALVRTLQELRPQYPRVDQAMLREMRKARRALLAE
ncbi:MAG: polyphosphate kinase 2 family protein [Rhizobiales bacterium]|nr:polyphosphate kinase 2 family protein [Hyphomicrobiales bacterium]